MLRTRKADEKKTREIANQIVDILTKNNLTFCEIRDALREAQDIVEALPAKFES